MLELRDSWVWDFWIADDGSQFHLFFLFASRALGDESLRHRRASVGHAVSPDLYAWRRVADSLVRSDPPAVDDIATWTGSVVRGQDGSWRMFYTGVSDRPVPYTQQITSACSRDLTSWMKSGRTLAKADQRWYATGQRDGVEPFRDPWVFRYDGRWHLIATAQAAGNGGTDGGVLAHAVSDDLESWQVLAPLGGPGHGFGHFEVPQVVEIAGKHYLLFSCLGDMLSTRRSSEFGDGGIWIAHAGSPIGPFDLDACRLLSDANHYSGRAVRDRNGVWMLLAFQNVASGKFAGYIADPVELEPLIRSAFQT